MMTWWRACAFGVTVLAMGAFGVVMAADPEDKPGKEGEGAIAFCPVMGEPINLAVSTPTKDGPVYFCCKNCIKRFARNPEKYADQVAAQRHLLAKRDKVQVLCPVSGKGVDDKAFIENNGKKILFCCTGCIEKYKADPAKYKSGLANAYTYQTKCPVMGGHIDPTAFTTLASGLKVYYCCPGCDKKFKGNPAKYLPKLAAQGIDVKVSDVKAKDDHADHSHDG